MGRSIPSFRMLIDIERLGWKVFKERLSNKQDKESLNDLFTVPKLYCHSLSNVSRPVIMEPILLSVLFHSFKEIDKIAHKSNMSNSNRKDQCIKLQDNVKTSHSSPLTNEEIRHNDCQYAKILEVWKDFSDCLSEDESVFTNMITNCYSSYHRSINSCNDDDNKNDNSNFRKNKGSKSCLNRINSLFMALFLHQQKQLNMIKSNRRLLDSYH